MMYSPSARLAELVSTHLDDFFEAVEKEHVQVRSIVACGVGGWIGLGPVGRRSIGASIDWEIGTCFVCRHHNHAPAV